MNNNIKRDIYSKKKKILKNNIFLTIFCVLMIPFIPVGFIFSEYWYLLTLAILGIPCALFLFYGLPFIWIRLSLFNRRVLVYDAIVNDNLYSVSDISKYTLIQEKEIIFDIRYLITNKYLVGYLFDGERLSSNGNLDIEFEIRNKNEDHIAFSKTCPNCGANDWDKVDNEYVCNYCGTRISR